MPESHIRDKKTILKDNPFKPKSIDHIFNKSKQIRIKILIGTVILVITIIILILT